MPDLVDHFARDLHPFAYTIRVTLNRFHILQRDIHMQSATRYEVAAETVADVLGVEARRDRRWIGSITDDIVGADPLR